MFVLFRVRAKSFLDIRKPIWLILPHIIALISISHFENLYDFSLINKNSKLNKVKRENESS